VKTVKATLEWDLPEPSALAESGKRLTNPGLGLGLDWFDTA
jgi:hypothetical protein